MQPLAMIGFVAPWMAWGAAAAVGLPVLAHLLSRTRYREVVFPAARLVQQAVAATSRIETPRHRMLMLLRWLILMLLVFAFMRPQWTPQTRAGSGDRGIALVLLIDASASMQRAEGGVVIYDRALRQAEQLIAQLDPARDVASVIRLDHAPTALLPEPTAQFSLLADRLAGTEAGYTHANWPGAIAATQRLIKDERRAIRIVTLSDQQGEPPVFVDLLTDRPDVRVEHLRIESPSQNTAVRLLDVRPYPAIAGQPMTATVEVQHFGDRTASIDLTCRFGPAEQRRSLVLQPNERRVERFTLATASGKRELIQVTIDQADPLTADNITGRVVDVQSQTRVVIVHDADPGSESLAKRFALLLNPGEVQGVTLPGVQTAAVDRASEVLAGAEPATLRTVVLLNQSALPDEASQALEAFAQSGGGVLQFVTDASADPKRISRAKGIDFELEPLRLFQGPARAGLSALPWPGVGNAPIDERATPILLDALERVIIAEMPRGRGRLIAINATLSPEPGGLLAQPAFVVLFNELCRYASPGPALPAPARPGDPIPAGLLDAPNTLRAKGANPTATVFTAPGPYGAMDTGGFVEELVFVELDPSESDTSIQPPWMLGNSASSEGAIAGQAGTAAVGTIRDQPIELWPYLVLGMLGLAACESVLLWRFAGPRASQAKGGGA